MKNKLTPEQATQKIRQYCAYQERSHFETREKLYSFGLHKPDVEKILSNLIEENYLNEERYASQFVGGHIRIKKWGRIKINAALQQKKLSSYNIKKALREIDEAVYLQNLQKLAAEKWKALDREQWMVRVTKTTAFLLQRGYEQDLIRQVIAGIRTKEKS